MARADRTQFLDGYVLPAIRVEIGGPRLSLGVDPGAAVTVLPSWVADDLGLNRTHPVRWLQLAGVGVSPPIPVVRVPRMVVAGADVGPLEACVYDLPAVLRVDGLIGLDVLRRFRVTSEFDTRSLVLRPHGVRVRS